MFQPELIHESMLDALRDAVRALGGAKAVGLSVAAAPKRRGRPPGTKNKNKDVPADLPKPQRKREGRAGKKGGAREYLCFLGEDDTLQLARVDGDGEPIVLTCADAMAIAAFVERHRVTLEA